MLPWQNTTLYGQRKALIDAWEEGEDSVADLARCFHISRKTAHKFINRYIEDGEDGLHDRSRAPHLHPTAIPPEVADRIVQAKHAHPRLGPKKLIAILRRDDPATSWPAPSTAGVILDHAGLVRRRPRRRRRIPLWQDAFSPAARPNDCWCTDFKGWVRTADGVRIDPLTLQDASSRYLLACEALLHPSFHEVRPVFELAFREYGLPRVIRSDNGPPFATTALGGLSRFAVWLLRLGVIPQRIQPGHPEQNGRLERLHRTLNEDALNPVQPNPSRQQLRFDAFRDDYNHLRPHEALGQTTPASRYQPSPRPYPPKLEDPAYDDGVTVRRVRTNGEIKWDGELIYLSQALTGELVGLVQRDDRHWTVRFGPLEIGLLDARRRRILPTPVTLLPM